MWDKTRGSTAASAAAARAGIKASVLYRNSGWDLVDAGSVLFSEMGLEDKAAMRSIALDEHEIIEMMNQGEEGTTR